MPQKTALIWFRQDLRLHDNPALTQAINDGLTIIPVYILDDENASEWAMGATSRWWLHESLTALNQSLNGAMIFRKGKAEEIIPTLLAESGASAIYWNRCYEPWRIKRDEQIKSATKDSDIECHTFNGSLLWEPWEISKNDGTPYKVFTPFYKNGCLKTREPAQPITTPNQIDYADHSMNKGQLSDLALLPSIHWYERMGQIWTPGEAGAQTRLKEFLHNGLAQYKEGRDHPAQDNVSRLSPHLHFGEISPRQAWHDAQNYAQTHTVSDTDIGHFCSELGWREFSYHLLYHFPHIPRGNFQEKFNGFPWFTQESEALERWQHGQTGIPIVDAGMRQLWQEGWMHNRVRMIVASLLVKNMLTHWHRGEDWFWDTLVDADLASNAASWQWVAGSGADAAPYFRIFNPVTQGERFDPNGDYVRKYVPELKHMPNKYIHKPWDSSNPPANYPPPIVDLKQSRQRALDALQSTKQ